MPLADDKNVTFTRRSLARLSGAAACALGLGLALPSGRADADELGVSAEGEYTFVPEDALTLDDLPAEPSAYAASGSARVVNLGGDNRYATAAAEALYAFPSSKVAVVASGAGYADSICASGLAGALGCPILLTASTYVPDVTLSALRSMGVNSVVLLGSEAVASAAVLSALKGLGSVERVWGADRYATQMAVYEYGRKRGLWTGDTVVVASAMGFADALSASPVSYALKAPVFFCDASGTLPERQRTALSDELTAANFLLLGSETVTSPDAFGFLSGLSSARGGTTVRLGGATRYQTGMAIAEYAVKHLGFTWDGAAFASGQGPYDALGGGAVQGKERSVLLLADGTDASSVDVITRNGGSVDACVKFFGSTVVVPAETRSQICAKLGIRYLEGTSFPAYAISRPRMAELQVARGEKDAKGNPVAYEDFLSALDPDQHEYGTSAFYQFAELTGGYSGLSASLMDQYVADNCTYQESARGRTSNLREMGTAFVEAAQKSGINEAYLLAHAIWESGWGCSELACGWVPDKDGEVVVAGVSYPYKKGTAYYNFYGIGAVDANALAGGRALAVKEGWTTPERAITGAATWLSEHYLRRSGAAQDSLYLMKWDVRGAVRNGNALHEYCTGLGTWCTGISSVMLRCYKAAGWGYGEGLSFSVPVFAAN